VDTQKTVLLVDDDIDQLERVRAAVSKKYAVEIAHSGEDALVKIAARKIDCIVMDVMMGTLSDGLDAAKKIKEDPNSKTIPIIMLTGVHQHFDYRTQIDDDFFPRDRWFDKPMDPKALMDEIGKLIQ
jgi:CheY-like chemotaxis protein